MKKALVLVLTGAMVLSCAACGGSSQNASATTAAAESAASTTAAETSAAASEGSSSGETITLRISQTNPEKYVLGRACEHWAELVKDATNGRIVIETYHSGTLGDERESAEACQAGNLDFAVVNTAVLENFVPDYGVFSLPYTFKSYDHADKVFMGDIGTEMLSKLDSVGLIGLCFWEQGFRELTNSKHPVNSLADVKGLRIRVMENKLHQELWNALGADAVPMSWGDAYTALQQGAIDGQENALVTIESNGVQEINKYLAMTDHIYGTNIVVASPQTWNSLSADDQKILKDCMDETNTWEREQARSDADSALDRMMEDGLEVTYPDKQEFIDATAGIREEYTQFKDYMDQITALE